MALTKHIGARGEASEAGATMNILMLATCPFPTAQGTQVYIHQLATALCGAGHDVSLVTYGFGAGDISTRDETVAYRVHRARRVPGHTKLSAGPSWGRPVSDAALVFRALELALTGEFDLVHAHNYEGAIAGAIVQRLTGLPLVYHAHCLMGDELGTYFTGEASRRVGFAFGRWLDAVVPRLADLCVSVSAAAASRVSQCQVPTVYLPPAVSYGEAAVRLEGAPELVYLGNLDGYQSVEVMLGALELLASRGVRCAFVTGDHRAQALVRSHGLQETVRVVHHGEFAEVKRHLESARVALLPRTVSSGFPIKLVNYLAAGRPVVACKSGAQGLGQSEGVSVVPDGDERAFAGAVVALLEDPRQAAALGAAARATYEARFCWPSSVERFEEVYSTLLRRKRALP